MAVYENTQLNYLLPSSVQLLSYNGKPLTGGHIKVYIAGTNTKYITYKDWDETENPFDILIPSDGRVVVLAETHKSYDYYVYDSYKNLVFSRLNVSPLANGDITIEGQLTSVENSDGNIEITNQLIDGVNHFDVNLSQDIQDIIDSKVDEAPIDGKQYARKDASWVEVEGGSGSKTYTGVAPVNVDNVNNRIAVNHKELNVAQPLLFDTRSTTISVDHKELNVAQPLTFDRDTTTIGVDLGWRDISSAVTKSISNGQYVVLYNPVLRMVDISFQVNLFNVTTTNVIDILTINDTKYRPSFPNIACDGYAMLSQGSTDSLIFRAFIEDTGKMQLRFNSINNLVNIRIHANYVINEV